MAKRCSKCKTIKSNDCFYKRSDKPYLLQSHCIFCIKEKRKNYRFLNIEQYRLRDKVYLDKNREKRNSYNREYNKRNLQKRSHKNKLRYKTDILFKLQTNIRNRIRIAIKRNYKKSCSLELLGCSITYFKIYFTSKFTKNMSWNLFMKGQIEIDHIKPCNSFDLSQEEEQRKCFNYKNLQPLFAKDNRSKGFKFLEV